MSFEDEQVADPTGKDPGSGNKTQPGVRARADMTTFNVTVQIYGDW